MAWDALRFCIENQVPYWLSGKNVRPGWVHIRCPLCGDHSNHGGFDPESGSYACWRCKGSHPVEIIRQVLHIPRSEAQKVYDEYDGAGMVRRALNGTKDEAPRPSSIELPGDTLREPHRRYLRGRGFDPDYLTQTYGILGTGPMEKWQESDFRLRIIIPIYDHLGRLVNFQGRDITGKQELRYKGCPIEKAIVHHKHLVYGAHLAPPGRVVVVEGVFDMWRMGPGFVCTFGTSLTDKQIAVLSRWNEIIFLFDPEDQAQAQAKEYAIQLSSLGRSVELVRADFGVNQKGEARDPGDLSPEEAEQVRQELLR